MAEIQNPVLAVIDMQKGFLNEHSNHIMQNVSALISSCQILLIPIIFSRFFNFVGSPYERFMGWGRARCEPETDIADELVHFAETLIDKSFYTALTPKFIELVKENNWETIILCGIATESCVLKTAIDAFELGFRPIVISDACASDMGPKAHMAGLLVLESLIGRDQIMTSHQLIENLNRKSA